MADPLMTTTSDPPWAAVRPAVICLGLSALDYIWQVDRLPQHRGGSKTRAHTFLTRGGGMAATAAVAVSRLGGRAAFWGRAGDDPEGRLMSDALIAEGVDVTNFRLFPDARSSVSGVIVEAEGERQIVNFRGGNLPEAADWLPLGDIATAGAVLADPRWPAGAVAAFAAARAARVPTVLDADVADAAVFEALLPLTDHAIFSAPALEAFAGADHDDALARVQAFGCTVAAVTLGEDGVVWRTATGAFRQPAYQVPVIDTNGAGDVFHGAYAWAIAAGAPVADAMAFAAAAAALKCMKPDGRSGIPGLRETLDFQRDHR